MTGYSKRNNSWVKQYDSAGQATWKKSTTWKPDHQAGPTKRPSKDSLSDVMTEAFDGSEQRLRSFNNVMAAIDYEPDLRSKSRSYTAFHKQSHSQLQQLKSQKEALEQGSSRRKSTKLKNLLPKIRKQEKITHSALVDVNTAQDQLEKIRNLKPELQTPDISSAIDEWVHGEEVQSTPVRTLAGWNSHGQPWLERNRQAGREPEKGEVLNVDNGWTDYVNQGWMQGGYDRGAAFRLLTPVSPEVVGMQRKALKTGDWQAFETDMTAHAKQQDDRSLWHQGNQRRTFYGQELVDLTRNNYAIHEDSGGRQVAMPKQRSQLLQQISAFDKSTLKKRK